MKLKTPLDGPTLANHFRYHKWLYLLFLVVPVVLWNLVYAQTAYRVPQEKRIDVYIQTSTADADAVNAWLAPIWQESVPAQELVNAVLMLSPGGQEDYYASVQLVTYLAAAEGDIYLLTTGDFKRLASQEAFVELTPYIQRGILQTGDVDLAAGYVTPLQDDDNGGYVAGDRRGLYGVPAYTLYGLATDLKIDNRDMVFAVAGNSGNEEASVRLLSGIIQHAQAPLPDFFK